MSGIWGNNIRVSIFGESHGNAIGITIDGLPSGFEIDLDMIDKEMKRRDTYQGIKYKKKTPSGVVEISI